MFAKGDCVEWSFKKDFGMGSSKDFTFEGRVCRVFPDDSCCVQFDTLGCHRLPNSRLSQIQCNVNIPRCTSNCNHGIED